MKKSCLLFLPILLTFSLYSSKATKENFANAEWIDESEMRNYLYHNIPYGWYKVGRIIDVNYQDYDGNYYTEKCQLITNYQVWFDNKVVASEYVNSSIVSDGNYSFTLSYKEVTGSTNISGGYFNAGGGVGGNISTPFFEVFASELTATYTLETTRKNTFVEATSISYSISTAKAGMWQLSKVRVLEQYSVIRFTKQERYRQEAIYDSKGHLTGYKTVFDHYAYAYSRCEDFTVLVDQYFNINH